MESIKKWPTIWQNQGDSNSVKNAQKIHFFLRSVETTENKLRLKPLNNHLEKLEVTQFDLKELSRY